MMPLTWKLKKLLFRDNFNFKNIENIERIIWKNEFIYIKTIAIIIVEAMYTIVIYSIVLVSKSIENKAKLFLLRKQIKNRGKSLFAWW